jgi:hypothetical protein
MQKRWILFVCLLLANLTCTSFAGVIDFIPELEQLCGSQKSITNKKILLNLASRLEEDNYRCNAELQFLIKRCPSGVSCDELISSFKKFQQKDSSVLIGE